MEEAVQTVQNPTQQNNVNSVQPITVPVQIQPVIAQPTNSAEPQSTLNNVQNVQTQQQIQPATPVEYKNPVQPTVQQPTQTQSQNTGFQIKKIDTSAIDSSTPAGQYRSAYGNVINEILTELYNKRYFEYNPNEDLALQQAIDYSEKTTTSSLASRGILNSTITAERIAKVVSDLTAEYRKLALSEWQTQMNMIANVGQMYMNMDEYEFKKWQDARDREWKEKLQAYQEQQDAIKNAWTRVDELGYVDNKASTVLGVAVGTLSKDARQAKEAYQRELEMMYKKAEVQYNTEKKLAEVKNDLQKDLIKYEYNYSSKASSNKANTVSLSTYDDILKNQDWMEYDDFTKKYKVTDNDKAYNYLMQEYNAGRLSTNDAASLIAKYGIQDPNAAKQARLEYLRQLSEM